MQQLGQIYNNIPFCKYMYVSNVDGFCLLNFKWKSEPNGVLKANYSYLLHHVCTLYSSWKKKKSELEKLSLSGILFTTPPTLLWQNAYYKYFLYALQELRNDNWILMNFYIMHSKFVQNYVFCIIFLHKYEKVFIVKNIRLHRGSSIRNAIHAIE